MFKRKSDETDNIKTEQAVKQQDDAPETDGTVPGEPVPDETAPDEPVPDGVVPDESAPEESKEKPLFKKKKKSPDYEAQYAEMLDRYQRTLAEFDNFRKRTSKEKAAMYDDGVRALAEKLLPVLDNFERALNASENKEDNFYQGVAMIARQFENVLTDMGVEHIVAVDEAFDPNLHYAVAHVEDEAFGVNVITEEMQKGYKHKDKVLRPSMVRVAN